MEVDELRSRTRSLNITSFTDAPPKVSVFTRSVYLTLLLSYGLSYSLFFCSSSLMFCEKPSRIKSSGFSTLNPRLHLQVIIKSIVAIIAQNASSL